MKIQLLSLLFSCLLLFSCSEKTETNSNTNEWELVIEDSIQVDYLGNIWHSNFKNGFGYLRDISTNSIIKFDTTGAIVAEKTYPKDGPGAIDWFSSSIISDSEELYASTYGQKIHHFDKDLNLLENLEMPFISESRGGRKNAKNIGFWQDKLILWYPGRDGISPYIDFFFRDYPILELFDPKDQSSEPIIILPKTSKFNSDLFFDMPNVQFSVLEDRLYFALTNEEQIHIHSLADSGQWIKSINFEPSEFHLIPGQKEPVGYVSGNTMYEATIEGIYALKNTVVISYSSGIPEDIFKQNELNKPENYFRYPEFRKNFLRLYQEELGLSNEIVIPSKIDFILNIESTDKPFYALRNDEFIGEEKEYLTFYKLRLVQK